MRPCPLTRTQSGAARKLLRLLVYEMRETGFVSSTESPTRLVKRLKTFLDDVGFEQFVSHCVLLADGLIPSAPPNVADIRAICAFLRDWEAAEIVAAENRTFHKPVYAAATKLLTPVVQLRLRDIRIQLQSDGGVAEERSSEPDVIAEARARLESHDVMSPTRVAALEREAMALLQQLAAPSAAAHRSPDAVHALGQLAEQLATTHGCTKRRRVAAAALDEPDSQESGGVRSPRAQTSDDLPASEDVGDLDTTRQTKDAVSERMDRLFLEEAQVQKYWQDFDAQTGNRGRARSLESATIGGGPPLMWPPPLDDEDDLSLDDQPR